MTPEATTRAGLQALGEHPVGIVYHHTDTAHQAPLAEVWSRRCGPTDTRCHWYITPDGRLWCGATFAARQNPGPGIRAAVARLGDPGQWTLAELGL